LAEIVAYIEQFDSAAAERMRERIEGSEAILSHMPYAFKKGRVPGTREYVAHPNYIVVYEADSHRVRVLRVIHARRMWP
jgi:toxin ParE1/3/4